MKANYEQNELIVEGKEKAKKYAKWGAENKQNMNEWTPVDPGTDITSGMTMYDVAKQGAAAAPALSEEGLLKLKEDLIKFAQTHFDTDYMLLCNERRDYTLFTNHKKLDTIFETLAFDVIDCLQNRGTIVDYEVQEETGGVELWIKDFADDSAAYYFFPYGEAVIKYGE